MRHHRANLPRPGRDQIELPLHVRADGGLDQVGVDGAVALHEHDAELGRDHGPAGADVDVATLADVLDVRGNRRIPAPQPRRMSEKPRPQLGSTWLPSDGRSEF